MANNHSDEFYAHQPSLNPNGYLYCRNCHGYYSLKDDETPDDFVSCECSEELVFYESFPNFSDSGFDEFDDLIEIEQVAYPSEK